MGGSDEDRPDEVEDDYMPIVVPGCDADTVRALADAERAVATHTATPEQARGVRAAGHSRRSDDRVAGWRDRTPPPPA